MEKSATKIDELKWAIPTQVAEKRNDGTNVEGLGWKTDRGNWRGLQCCLTASCLAIYFFIS